MVHYMKLGNLVLPVTTKQTFSVKADYVDGKHIIEWDATKEAIVLAPDYKFEDCSWTKLLLPDGRIGWTLKDNVKVVGNNQC